MLQVGLVGKPLRGFQTLPVCSQRGAEPLPRRGNRGQPPRLGPGRSPPSVGPAVPAAAQAPLGPSGLHVPAAPAAGRWSRSGRGHAEVSGSERARAGLRWLRSSRRTAGVAVPSGGALPAAGSAQSGLTASPGEAERGRGRPGERERPLQKRVQGSRVSVCPSARSGWPQEG